MWTRAELKDRAKISVKRNYWLCVIAALLLMLLCSSNASASSNNDNRDYITNLYGFTFVENGLGQSMMDLPVKFSFGTGIMRLVLKNVVFTNGLVMASAVAAALILAIFVCGPLEVGIRKFFLVNAEEDAPLSLLLAGFESDNYMNVVKTMLLRNLQIFFGYLLFVIPGIVFSYQLRMVPYILAEYPDMSPQEVTQMSKDMMDGEKINALILDFSFLPWLLLGAVTGGIVNLFWTNPYLCATNAELYRTLRHRVNDGIFEGTAF